MAMIAFVSEYHTCIFYESRDMSALVSIYMCCVNDIYDTKHFIVPHLSQIDTCYNEVHAMNSKVLKFGKPIYDSC